MNRWGLSVVVLLLPYGCKDSPRPIARAEEVGSTASALPAVVAGLSFGPPALDYFPYALACAESSLRLHFSTRPIVGCERGFQAEARSVLLEVAGTPPAGEVTARLFEFEPAQRFWFPELQWRNSSDISLAFSRHSDTGEPFVEGRIRGWAGSEGTFRAQRLVVEKSGPPTSERELPAHLEGTLFERDFGHGSVLAYFVHEVLRELRLYTLPDARCADAESAIHLRVSVPERVVTAHSLFWSDKLPAITKAALELGEHFAVDVGQLEYVAEGAGHDVAGQLQLRARWGSSELAGHFRARRCPVITAPSPRSPPVQSALLFLGKANSNAVSELRLYDREHVSCSAADDVPYHRLRSDAEDSVLHSAWTSLPMATTVSVRDDEVAPYYDRELGRFRTQVGQTFEGTLQWTGVDPRARVVRGRTNVPRLRLAAKFEAQICESSGDILR